MIVVVVQLCLTLCDPMNCSMSAFLILHSLLEFTQTHIHWVSDAIYLLHHLSPPSPLANLSQHQGLLQWVSSLHQVGKGLELQLQHQFFWDWLVWSPCRPRDSQVFFSTVLKHQFFGAQPSLRSKSLIYTWLLKNHNFNYADLGQQSGLCFLIHSFSSKYLKFWLRILIKFYRTVWILMYKQTLHWINALGTPDSP